MEVRSDIEQMNQSTIVSIVSGWRKDTRTIELLTLSITCLYLRNLVIVMFHEVLDPCCDCAENEISSTLKVMFTRVSGSFIGGGGYMQLMPAETRRGEKN